MEVWRGVPLLCVCVCCAWPWVSASPLQDVRVESSSVPVVCSRQVQSGDYVRYHYTGTFTDGRAFDSSLDKGAPFMGRVGVESKVIPGLDKGVIGMCVNERRKITIPPHLAYGVTGAGTVIPPDTTLVFNVQLLDVWNQEDRVETRTLHLPERCGRLVKNGDFVRYRYNASLFNGTEFHRSHERTPTYDTYVGRGELIKGMEEGLLGMCVGERRAIIIPPFLAYGENGYGLKVPAYATVIFEVLLVDVFNVEDDVQVEVLERPQPCGRQAQVGDYVRYHYNGTFQDGTPFDSSYQRNSTYNTYIGHGQVIAGVERALHGVCAGERRRVTVPPHLAYGEQGAGDLIPGSAVLVFELHIVDFHNTQDKLNISVTHKPADCSSTSTTNDLIRYRYNCSLLDGTRLYSSDDSGKPQQTTLGQGKLIWGLDQGLQGMCVGERRDVIVPPHLGHGPEGGSGVPGGAVLLFQLELVELQQGVPEGFLFVWLEDDGPEPLFPAMDLNHNQEVPLEEFTAFIKQQVQEGKGRLHPGLDRDTVIRSMFSNQDSNGDGRITEDELKLQTEDKPGHEEL